MSFVLACLSPAWASVKNYIDNTSNCDEVSSIGMCYFLV